MTLVLDGSTGVSAVQDGVVTAADLASGAITASALPAGSVLQVVQGTYQTYTDFNTGTYTDSGLTVTITPSSATSKVLVTAVAPGCGSDNGANTSSRGMYRLVSVISGATTAIQNLDSLNGYTATTSADFSPVVGTILHTPSTTSAVTYKLQYQSDNGGTVAFLKSNSGQVPLGTITAMEIAG